MTGGNYSLTGGFWALIAAVQTPGAPLLTITFNPQLSTINVSWPSPSRDEGVASTTANVVKSAQDATVLISVYLCSVGAMRRFVRAVGSTLQLLRPARRASPTIIY